jgi:hypothetical protein
MVSTRSVAVAPLGSAPDRRNPTTLRDQHRDGLAEHRGLGLDAADAPAENPEAVLHRGVRVGADAGVGVGDAIAVHHDPGQVLDVHLVHDAGAGRDHLEPAERVLAPAQELEPLVVALELELHVPVERVRAPNTSATTEWSMTSSAGQSGLILVASPPRACMASRIAARSTTAGTPVRSCRITRAGVNWISVSGSASGSQLASAR